MRRALTVRETSTAKASLNSLATAAADGDLEAFEQLVLETTPGIYALALRLLGNEQDAADAVQETYLRAFRAIGRFRGDSAVTTWLYRIAANRCSTLRARREAHATTELDESILLVERRQDQLPELAADGAEEFDRLVKALHTLPYSLRAVVVLHDVYDLPHDVIASELAISNAAAKVRLHRARRRLRDVLYPASGSDTIRGARSARAVRSSGRRSSTTIKGRRVVGL